MPFPFDVPRTEEEALRQRATALTARLSSLFSREASAAEITDVIFEALASYREELKLSTKREPQGAHHAWSVAPPNDNKLS